MLDVECSARGTPESYVQKVRLQHKHNSRLFESKSVASDLRVFGIQHFAGRVVYDASDCLGMDFSIFYLFIFFFFFHLTWSISYIMYKIHLNALMENWISSGSRYQSRCSSGWLGFRILQAELSIWLRYPSVRFRAQSAVRPGDGTQGHPLPDLTHITHWLVSNDTVLIILPVSFLKMLLLLLLIGTMDTGWTVTIQCRHWRKTFTRGWTICCERLFTLSRISSGASGPTIQRRRDISIDRWSADRSVPFKSSKPSILWLEVKLKKKR